MPRKSITCGGCGMVSIPSKGSTGKYCSVKCQQNKALRDRASKWLGGKASFSNRALNRIITLLRGYRCDVCGLSEWMSKPITLEVEHRDGNSLNCAPENVCLICPNCHSQTPTYKARNKGNGRHYRRQRYAEGKSY